jgi:hypothetical protein
MDGNGPRGNRDAARVTKFSIMTTDSNTFYFKSAVAIKQLFEVHLEWATRTLKQGMQREFTFFIVVLG